MYLQTFINISVEHQDGGSKLFTVIKHTNET